MWYQFKRVRVPSDTLYVRSSVGQSATLRMSKSQVRILPDVFTHWINHQQEADMQLIRDVKCRMGFHDWETLKVTAGLQHWLGKKVWRCRNCNRRISSEDKKLN